MSKQHPVRIKVYGGSLNLLPPGSEWRVERITEHQQPSGAIGEPMTEWTLIDLAPAAPPAAPLDVPTLVQAYANVEGASAWTANRRGPAAWVERLVKDILREYARLSDSKEPNDE